MIKVPGISLTITKVRDDNFNDQSCWMEQLISCYNISVKISVTVGAWRKKQAYSLWIAYTAGHVHGPAWFHERLHFVTLSFPMLTRACSHRVTLIEFVAHAAAASLTVSSDAVSAIRGKSTPWFGKHCTKFLSISSLVLADFQTSCTDRLGGQLFSNHVLVKSFHHVKKASPTIL